MQYKRFVFLFLISSVNIATSQTKWSLHLVPGYQSKYSLATYDKGYKHKDYTFFEKKYSLLIN